jgi:glycine oxidase
VKSFGAIVVGAGLIGCSIARELAQRGLRVVALDRQEPGKEASWAAAGMLTPASESIEEHALVPLANASLALYPEFIAQIESSTGMSTGYRRDGALEVFFGDGAEQKLRYWLAAVRSAGFHPEPLNALELRRAEPALAADAVAGAFLADEGSVDNRLLAQAAAEAARHDGVELRTGEEVVRLNMAAGRVTGVETRSGKIAAAHVVLAAGCFSAQIEGAQRYAPTIPARGQMAALRPAERPLRHVVRGPSYLVPRHDGRLVIGATVERVGFEKAVTASAIGKLLGDAVRMVPALAAAPVVETWSGLRPDTPDHLPILGPADMEGLWLATGHYRNGILLAPATARALGEWITEGRTTLPIEGFSPLRFAAGSQGRSQTATP